MKLFLYLALIGMIAFVNAQDAEPAGDDAAPADDDAAPADDGAAEGEEDGSEDSSEDGEEGADDGSGAESIQFAIVAALPVVARLF